MRYFDSMAKSRVDFLRSWHEFAIDRSDLISTLQNPAEVPCRLAMSHVATGPWHVPWRIWSQFSAYSFNLSTSRSQLLAMHPWLTIDSYGPMMSYARPDLAPTDLHWTC